MFPGFPLFFCDGLFAGAPCSWMHSTEGAASYQSGATLQERRGNYPGKYFFVPSNEPGWRAGRGNRQGCPYGWRCVGAARGGWRSRMYDEVVKNRLC